MRTAGDYILAMRHALGKTPSSNHDLWQTFNDAGKALFTCAMVEPWNHEWTWARKVTYDIDIPASVDAFEVPAEFGQLVQVGYETVLTKSVSVVSVTALEELRRGVVTPSGVIYVAYPYDLAKAGTVEPRGTTRRPVNRVGVYPQQDEAVTDLKWTFQRVWVEMHDDDNDAVPHLDPQGLWERLLVLMAQSFAKCFEDQEDGWLTPSIGEEIQRLVALDSNRSYDARPTTYSVRRAAGRVANERLFERVTKT